MPAVTLPDLISKHDLFQELLAVAFKSRAEQVEDVEMTATLFTELTSLREAESEVWKCTLLNADELFRTFDIIGGGFAKDDVVW